MSKSGRIKDIARLAGVSIGTVDRVLHKRGRVSSESLKKVEAALTQLQYKPNVLASSLRRNKGLNITVLMPEVFADEYWSKTKYGILKETETWSHFGCNVKIREFDIIDHLKFTELLTQTLLECPDGLVLAPIHYDESLKILKETNYKIPVALFNTNIVEIEPLCFVGQDLKMSGRVAAQLMHGLIEDGGTLAIVHADEDFEDAPHLLEKENGFREFFQENIRSSKKFSFIRLTNSNSLSELILDFKGILKNSDLKGVFVTTSKGTSIIGHELNQWEKRDVLMIGYDILEKNIDLLKNGTINYLINQNPQFLGSFALNNILSFLVHNRHVKKQILFPIDIVTSENLASYIQFNKY